MPEIAERAVGLPGHHAGDLVVGYGADITIAFRPNAFVDAERIEFVQVARSVKNGKPHNKYDANDKERTTAESRMVPGDGAHVDQQLARPRLGIGVLPPLQPALDHRHRPHGRQPEATAPSSAL